MGHKPTLYFFVYTTIVNTLILQGEISMGALTNYLESGLINHLFRGIPYTAPSTLYIGLTKSFNSGNLESGIADEPTSGSYARQSYPVSTSSWIAPYVSGTSMITHNTSAIEFPIATANIGDISGVFIADSLTSGNITLYGALSSSRNIREGDQFVFSSGSLKISLN